LRILGIDPGSRVTGYGVVEFDRGRLSLVMAGAITAGSRAPDLPARLRSAADGLRDVIHRWSPEVAAVENVFHHANVRSALVLAHVRGALILEAARAALVVHEYTALQVKKALVGNGHAEKEQVRSMVMRLLSLKELPRPHDVSDALAVAICHAHSSRVRSQWSGK